MSKKFIFSILLACMTLFVNAQSMKGRYYNEEYQVFLYLHADSADVKVPGQDIYGDLPGYFGSKRDSRLWLITDCERINDKKVEITVINDYGSEDFTATLTEDANGNITMKHIEGSTYKIVVKSKYVKIPKTITFVKQ